MDTTNTNRFGGLLVALLLILGGCGSQYYFTKPDFSQQQYEQDKYECLRSAQQPMLISPAPGMSAGGMATNKEIYLACFRAKGYTVQSEEEREQIVRAAERANHERLVQQREQERQLREETIQRERLVEKRRVDEEKVQQPEADPKSYVYLPGYTEEDVPMVLIPEGEFLFGTDNVRTSLPAFYIDKNEITTQLYASFMQATNHSKPEHWGDVRPELDGDKPVIGVEWSDANEYCHYYGKRLPTEKEWEKAARGTDGRIYPWGNWEPSKSLANYGGQFCLAFCNVYAEKLKPVASYAAGGSPYGLYDMAGNAWEWVEEKRLRGGSWLSNTHTPELGLQSAVRTGEVTRTYGSRYLLGFRCAQDVR